MNKSINIFLLVFLLNLSLFAQNNTGKFYKDIILIKVDSKYKNIANKKDIKNADFHAFLGQLSTYNLVRAFPNHKSPTEVLNQYGDSLVDLSLWYKLNYKSTTPTKKLISQIESCGVFQYVEQRAINKLLWIPNDTFLSKQYYLDRIHMFEAWDIEKGDTNIVVGITDTGIDKVHEDLIDGIKYNYEDTLDGIDNDNDGFIDNFCGWDVGNNDNNAQFGLIGHGTFVSGFVSGVPNNNKGIAGVGYDIKILPVKIDDTLGYLSSDYEGIVYAADHNAFVINCSWGGTFGSQYGRDIVNYATNNRGALIVAACGNSNNDTYLYPASYENVFSCAATDSNDVRWENSSFGAQVDISAPGTDVFSTWTYNYYISSHGTSFSSPIVAAVAALVKSHFPNLSNHQVAEKVRVNADIIDTIAANSSTVGLLGSGRVNAYAALTDSVKPSIRMKNRVVNIHNDTIEFTGEFINYLSTSSGQTKAVVSVSSPYLSVMDSVFSIGILNTLSSISNNAQPFTIRILPNVPIGYYTDIKITYTDTDYTAHQYFRVFLNQDNAILDTNNIITSVNSYSTIGYTDGTKMVGNGFTFKNYKNILSIAGLVVASSSNRVSDNVYGLGGNELDFIPLSPAQKIEPATKGDQMWFNKYNDDSATVTKNNIEVEQYSYAFNNEELNDIIFLHYTVKNTGNTSLDNTHIGMYADWDIYRSYANKAKYDSILKLAYTYPSFGAGGTYIGIQLISDSLANCYNFDNDGFGGSINIYDGFLNFEKYDAMTISRNIAGLKHSYGNDVSSMLSSGPYTINAGNSVSLLFALVAGENEYEIKNNAQKALDWYFNTASLRSNIKNNVILNQNTPNPCNNTTSISFYLDKSTSVNLEIMDAVGHSVYCIVDGEISSGKHSYNINLSKFSSGVYYYRLTTNEITLTRKMIIQ
jgi:hypothetical protein